MKSIRSEFVQASTVYSWKSWKVLHWTVVRDHLSNLKGYTRMSICFYIKKEIKNLRHKKLLVPTNVLLLEPVVFSLNGIINLGMYNPI